MDIKEVLTTVIKTLQEITLQANYDNVKKMTQCLEMLAAVENTLEGTAETKAVKEAALDA